MTRTPDAATYSIGWDVGGWNCDRNATSRDALCILDARRGIIGKPWRGNLRQTINQEADTPDWLRRIFTLCGAPVPDSPYHVTLAIDTPLGFSTDFVDLITHRRPVASLGVSGANLYLFRRTERLLCERGLRPLSAIKDMIGSQATKGIHALARFAPIVQRCGVWTDGGTLTAIEAYPAPCARSALVRKLIAGYPNLDHGDKRDALTCALIGHLFAHQPDQLEAPDDAIPESEGWIWLPRDCFAPS